MTSAYPTTPPTRAELRRTGRMLTAGTWVLIGAVCTFSAMTGAQFIGAHSPWHWSGWVLAAGIDIAFVMALQADATLARFGSTGGRWPSAFRWLTGAFSVFVNIGDAALQGDLVGVAVHLIAPALLLVLGEAGPAWRRQLVHLERAPASRDLRPNPDGPLTTSQHSGTAEPHAPTTAAGHPESTWNGGHLSTRRTRNHTEEQLPRHSWSVETSLPPAGACTRATADQPEVTATEPQVPSPRPDYPPEVTTWGAHPASAVRTPAEEVRTAWPPEQPVVPARPSAHADGVDTDGTDEYTVGEGGEQGDEGDVTEPPADAREARSRIVRGRLDGLSQRETARWAHRSPTFVRKIWTTLDEDHQHEPGSTPP
ncbi:hypothetical protein [Kitasatospora azatica]|uniref:hypothetical protein n=1 Tax=Kitasatospora azatica TaxID=58347 RepID=UPI0006918667|nr:hypothetical protein [Kitasatospora azatica]